MFKPYLNESLHTIDLDHEQMLVFDDRAGTRVQVLYGGLWLTEERSREDRFADAGQWLQLERGGRAVAESIGRSRVRIVEAAPRAMAAWRDAVRAWWPLRHELATKSLAVSIALLVGIGLPELLARSFQDTPDAGGAAFVERPSEPRVAGSALQEDGARAPGAAATATAQPRPLV